MIYPFIHDKAKMELLGIDKGMFTGNMQLSESLPNVEKVIEVDGKRRSVQTELDNILSESNKISKEIGKLFQSGEVQKANIAKEKTGQLKEKSKVLSDTLDEVETESKEESIFVY